MKRMKRKLNKNGSLSPFFIAHFCPQQFSLGTRWKGEKILSFGKRPNLLDAGCGCGWLSRMAIKDGYRVVSVDISQQVIELEKIFAQATGQPALKIIKASVTKLPFKAGTFDTVLCSEVLEHLSAKEINQALVEFYRVLKSNGIVLVAIPGFLYSLVYDKLFKHFTQDDSRNIYERFLQSHLPTKAERQLIDKCWIGCPHINQFSPKVIHQKLERVGFTLLHQQNLEIVTPFLRSIANKFTFTRDKICLLERLDILLAERTPLALGTDWLFVGKKK